MAIPNFAIPFSKFVPVLLRAQDPKLVTQLVVDYLGETLGESIYLGLLLDNIGHGKSHSVIKHNQRKLADEELRHTSNHLRQQLGNTEEQPFQVFPFMGSNTAETSLVLHAFAVSDPLQSYGWLVAVSNLHLSDDNIQFVETVAELAAIALDNAMRFQDLKDTAFEMTRVNELAVALTASLNSAELFKTFMEQITGDVAAERSLLLFVNSEKSSFAPAFAWHNTNGEVQNFPPEETPLTECPVYVAVETKSIMEYTPPASSEFTIAALQEFFANNYDNYLLIPLLVRKLPIAILALAASNTGVLDMRKLKLTLLERMSALFSQALLNSRLYEETQFSAEFDSRTGVFNHRYFERELNNQFIRARSARQNLGLVIVDLDHLKKINDQYGHLTGHQALRQVASLIVQSVRSSDIVARYGGDEFAVLLLNCTQQGLEVVAEKIRQAVEANPLVVDAERETTITVSVGAALYPMDAQDADQLLSTADQAMYQAKKDRNQARIGTTSKLILPAGLD